MATGEWERIEAVFEAIEGEPDEALWPEIFDRLCGTEGELRERVERLVRASREAPGFLEEPAALPELTRPEPATPYRPLAEGDRLGPYRILRRIGEGGMGSVFLAERSDGTFDLQVAVKVLRHGTEGPAAIARFERERQILAAFKHPSIARLLDGGTTEGGLPYVVMEYVEGEPIDQACERLGLSATSKVDLMLEVCDAVTAAHRALVVHRDLKPANILIDRDGSPKLLDFGIAKLLEAEGGAAQSLTGTDARRLTPSYASPEQLRGDPVTVATDVYLLGLVLYQLLAGELPFELDRRSLIDIEKEVTRGTPKSPSEVGEGVDRDLDAIVLKALRAEPEARYGSAEALAEDLRRYRQGLPVRARAGSLRYAASKTLRRHWLPISVAALFAVVLTSFAVSTAIQARRLEETLDRLTAVHGFVLDLVAGADPEHAKGREVTLAELLERGERQLDLGEPQDEETRSMLRAVFGRLALHTGRLDVAQGHLEAATQGSQGDDVAGEIGHARAMSDLALARLYSEDDGAEAAALEALAAGRLIESAPPLLRLELLNTLAHLYCWDGRWEEAKPLVEEALTLTDTERPSRPAALALSLDATIAKNLDGDLKRAHGAYRQSLAMYELLEGEVYPEIANIHNQLGVIDAQRGELDAALAAHGRALDVRRRLYPDGHWEIAQSLSQRGRLQWRQGDLVAAESSLEAGWRLYAEEPSLGRESGRAIYMWILLAEVRLAQGQVDEAARMLDELSPEWWASRKKTSRLLSLARRATGCVAAARGELIAAEDALSSSLEALEARHGQDAWQTQIAADCLAKARSSGA